MGYRQWRSTYTYNITTVKKSSHIWTTTLTFYRYYHSQIKHASSAVDSVYLQFPWGQGHISMCRSLPIGQCSAWQSLYNILSRWCQLFIILCIDSAPLILVSCSDYFIYDNRYLKLVIRSMIILRRTYSDTLLNMHMSSRHWDLAPSTAFNLNSWE